jgi:hypothetical protein
VTSFTVNVNLLKRCPLITLYLAVAENVDAASNVNLWCGDSIYTATWSAFNYQATMGRQAARSFTFSRQVQCAWTNNVGVSRCKAEDRCVILLQLLKVYF